MTILGRIAVRFRLIRETAGGLWLQRRGGGWIHSGINLHGGSGFLSYIGVRTDGMIETTTAFLPADQGIPAALARLEAHAEVDSGRVVLVRDDEVDIVAAMAIVAQVIPVLAGSSLPRAKALRS